jgi:hypothetical protein
MKKSIVFLSILLVSLLSGCNFIDDSKMIEQTFEEFCAENPDDPACGVDVLMGLDDATVVAEFETITNQLLTNDEDFCESIGPNEDLKVACEEGMTFLPDGMEDFRVLSVSEEDGIYQVFIDTMTNSYIFDVSFIEDESGYQILSWQFGEVSYVRNSLYLESGRDLLEDFADDFYDETISTSDFCSMYYIEEAQTECMEMRDSDTRTGISASVTDVSFQNDNFMYEIEFTDQNTGDTETIIGMFLLKSDQYGNLKLRFGFSFENSPDDLYQLVDEFMNLYTNETISSDIVCGHLYEGSDFCLIERNTQLQEGTIVSSYEVIEEGPMFFLSITYLNNGQTFTEKYPIGIHVSENGYDLSILPSAELIPYDQAYNLVETMIIDINDGMSESDFCSTYGFEDNNCSFLYQELVSFETIILGLDVMDGYYEIYLSLSDGQTAVLKDYKLVLFYDENNTIRFDVIVEELPFDDIVSYINTVLEDYTNMQLSDDDFYSQHFPSGDIVLLRDILPGVPVYTTYNLSHLEEDLFHLTITIRDENTDELYHTLDIDVVVSNENGQISLHNPFSPLEQAFMTSISDLVVVANDETTPSSVFCMDYGQLFISNETCSGFKDRLIDGQYYTFKLIEDEVYYLIEFSRFDAAGEVLDIVQVGYNIHEFDNEMFITPMEQSDYFNVSEQIKAQEIISAFFLDYTDPTISKNDIESNYFSLQVPWQLLEDRIADLSNGISLDEIVFMGRDGQGFETLRITTSMNGETSDFDLSIRVLENDGTYALQLQELGMPYDPNVFEMLLHSFAELYNDGSILSSEVCYGNMMNDDEVFISSCISQRDSILQNNEYIILENYFPLVDGFFVSYEIRDVDGITGYLQFYCQYFEEDNVSYIMFDDMPS